MGDPGELPAGLTCLVNDNYAPERCCSRDPPPRAPQKRASPKTPPRRTTPRRAMHRVIKYSGKLKESLKQDIQALKSPKYSR